MDYECERGAKRNFEIWRDPAANDKPLETEDEMLDRIESEQAEAGGAMAELETKVVDAKREMEIADALDEIRTRNARISRAEGKDGEGEALEVAERVRREKEEEKRRVEREDEEAARKAFQRGIEIEEDDGVGDGVAQFVLKGFGVKGEMAPPPRPMPIVEEKKDEVEVPAFKRAVKKKKDYSAALGIKKRASLV